MWNTEIEIKISKKCNDNNNTYPKIVEGGVGDALPRDVLAKLFEHRRVLLHTDHSPRHELLVRPHRHVPRLYPHKVVKREFQY